MADATLMVKVKLAREDRREDVELLLGGGGRRHGDAGGGRRIAAPGATVHFEIHLGVLGGPRKARLMWYGGGLKLVLGLSPTNDP